jgi:NTE family protein
VTRIGLVLGAGGIVGQAYQAGVLAALEHDLGWDPRTADVIVGTSAGSVTGSLLRLNVPAHDLAAAVVEAPLSIESAPCHQLLDRGKVEFPAMSLRYWMRRWRLPSPALMRRLARQPWTLRLSVVALTMMPAGEIDLTEHASALDAVAPDPWPDGLWICAARRDDGRRLVFGRAGAPRAKLSQAVAASCAIPGYFCPQTINGVEYFDGAVHSATNADVLRGAGLDLVVAVAPMSAANGMRRTADGPLRYAAHRRLERELRCLADDGATVVRIEPAEDTLEVMGINMMAEHRTDEVVQAAFLETGRYAATPRLSARLAPLRRRGFPTAPDRMALSPPAARDDVGRGGLRWAR